MRCFKSIGKGFLVTLLFYLIFTFILGKENAFIQSFISLSWVGFSIYFYIKDKKKEANNPIKFSPISVKNTAPEEKSYSQDISIDNAIKKHIESDGYFTLWKGKPFIIRCRNNKNPNKDEHSVHRWAISKKGYEKLFCKDDDGQEYLLDVDDISTKIIYKKQSHDIFDEVMEKLLGFEKVYDIDNLRADYLNYLSELKEQQMELRELYSFSPVPVTFSIFGDYFDRSLPANHMKFKMLCSGLIGYKIDDEEIITELNGKNSETGEEVNIRLNAIRTMITLEDGKKYRKESFVELAKSWGNA